MAASKVKNKKIATIEKKKKAGVQNFSPSKKLSDSVVARKALSKPMPVNPRLKKLTADVFNLKGKVVGNILLPGEIFGAKINRVLVAQAVRVYLANQKQGNASTKSRGQVRGSTRKIRQQKGTGRARHGGIRAPIFVGGGIAFGPKPRDRGLELPKKMKKAALHASLSAKFANGQVKIIAGLGSIEPKTKVMAETLENFTNGGKALLVTAGTSQNIKRAARNLKKVHVITEKNLSTYDALDNSLILFMKEAIEELSHPEAVNRKIATSPRSAGQAETQKKTEAQSNKGGRKK